MEDVKVFEGLTTVSEDGIFRLLLYILWALFPLENLLLPQSREGSPMSGDRQAPASLPSLFCHTHGLL